MTQMDRLQVFLPLDEIRPSKTNPRRSVDKDAMAELTESVIKHGVLQPVLVRPLNGKAGSYELVAGHRRFTAAKTAALAGIPAIVKELNDQEVLEVQLIENLQREDLHPLEEADGYHLLHEKHGYSVEDLAVKVGKSKGYVYARLKLCELPNGVKAAFLEDKLSASVALLVARIPDPKLADEAAALVVKRDMSAREAASEIHERYMTALSGAPWKKDDATLVPEAGACSACPKRTGNQRDLFPDIKSADVCTDVACFARKREAWQARRLEEAREAGQQIITGKKAEEALRYGGPYVQLGGGCNDLPYNHKLYGKAWRQVLAKDAPQVVLVEQRERHWQGGRTVERVELVEAVPRAEALKVLRERYPKAKVSAVNARPQSAHDKARKARAARMKAVHRVAVEKIVAKASQMTPDLAFWRFLAGTFVGGGWHNALSEVMKRRGLDDGKTRIEGALKREIAKLDQGGLVALVVELLVTQTSSYEWHSGGYQEELRAGCALFRVDLKKLEREASAKVASKSKAPASKGRGAATHA